MIDLPIACGPSAPDLARRRAKLAAGLFGRAVRVEPIQHGYRWQFASTSDIFAQLAQVIDAERDCCRFLTFAVGAEPDLGYVTLDVTGPEGTREFLTDWFPT